MYLGDYHFTDTELKDIESGNNQPTPAETIREVYRVETKKS